MKYKIFYDNKPSVSVLDDLIVLVTCTSLVFSSYTEAADMRDILKVKFWNTKFYICYYCEETATWEDCYEN